MSRDDLLRLRDENSECAMLTSSHIFHTWYLWFGLPTLKWDPIWTHLTSKRFHFTSVCSSDRRNGSSDK